MSIIATAVKHLIAAGVGGDDLVRAIADMEAAAPSGRAPVDEAAERRRESDRIYQAGKRAKRRQNLPTSADSADAASLSLPPNENNSNPPTHTHLDNISAREPSEAHVSAWRAAMASAADKASRAKPATRLPDGWVPILTPSAQRIVDGWPPGRLASEIAAFVDHAADKGRTSKDWQAAFRTWLTNANRWTRNDRSAARDDDHEIRDPLARVAAQRQAERSAAERGQPDHWT